LDFEETERLHRAAAARFASHPYLALRYEDLTADFEGTAERLLAFLELPPQALTAAVGKLERRPLSAAIANYDSLRRDFADGPWAGFFEDEGLV
jgi:hypothetical protein